jgi:hypothetical protein
VVAAVAAVGVGIYELVQHWSEVTDFFGKIGKAIGDFIGGAWKSGTDFIGNFLGGIKDGFAKLWDNVYSNTFGKIAANTKHSKPTEGLFKDDDKWGAHFVQNWITGMESQMPALQKATNAMAMTTQYGMARGYTASNTSYSTSYGQSYDSSSATTNIYGASDNYIQKMIDTSINKSLAQFNPATRRVGTYRPGGYGF